MSRIFDADNAFFRFMSRVADALILNLFFLITSIPIVTIGASYTAMYYYCTKAVGNEEGYLWKSYWKSFKTNFVQGFLMELFFVVVGVILYVDLKYLYGNAFNGGGFGWRLLFFIVVGMAILAAVTFLYAFPLLSRFENTTFNIIRNAAFMSLRHLPQTVPLILIFGLAAFIGWAMFPVSIFFIVGAWVYVSSIFFYKILDRYMPKDERYDEDYYLGAEDNSADGVLNADTLAGSVAAGDETASDADTEKAAVLSDNGSDEQTGDSADSKAVVLEKASEEDDKHSDDN